MTEPEPLQQVDRTYVLSAGRKLSYFSGCDYFRLSSHPQVLAGMLSGAKKYGLNVAASRLTTGNHSLYQQLEHALRTFFDAEACLLVASGYLTNLVACQALAGNFSHGLLDEKAHPSLVDATWFLDCPVLKFQHRDAADLERAVARCGSGAKLLLLTDGTFSHDGSAAPLHDYLNVLPRDALLLVDDAHGAGVVGATGKGTLEHCGVSRRRIIQTITLSKAFGTYGGAILASRSFRQQMLDRSRLFVGHTPLPLPLASAALEAVRVLKTDRSMRERLLRNVAFVKSAWPNQGGTDTSPILSWIPSSARTAATFRSRLLESAIFPPFVKYPGGPKNGYFRFVLSSEHTRAQLNSFVSAVSGKARPAIVEIQD
jgi:7-keto-8-aminopelargonate synthetase-like enzyme